MYGTKKINLGEVILYVITSVWRKGSQSCAVMCI